MRQLSLLVILFCLISTSVYANDNFLTAKRHGDYAAALNDLTIAIADHNYTLIKIQPVDKGLRHHGYQTANYKVLFFGDGNQFDQLVAAHPEASVMLPLKIMLYQQGNTIVASAPDMEMWKGVFGSDITPIIKGWRRDVRRILRDFAGQ
jgi:uncharacterized protein (DUF302 family)